MALAGDAGRAVLRHRARRGLARHGHRPGDPVAGLQLIPKEFGEAAEIFGATPWTRFRKITLPLLKPSLQSALILRTVLAFEVFAVVYALGGRNLPVLVGEAYVWQNDNQNYGVAAAYAVLIMAISLAATLVYSARAANASGAAP